MKMRIEAELAVLLALMLLSSSCSGPVEPTANPSQSGASSQSSSVVFFNGDGGSAEVAKDSKAMKASLKYIAIGGAEAKAEMEAMKDSGRLFHVPNGTSAEVVEEGETVGSNTPMIVRITSGPHAGEKVMCFKGVTQIRVRERQSESSGFGSGRIDNTVATGRIKNTINIDTNGCPTLEGFEKDIMHPGTVPGCINLDRGDRVIGPLEVQVVSAGGSDSRYARIEVPGKGEVWTFWNHVGK